MYVHNVTSNVTTDSNGIALSPGTETNIAVERSFITKKSKPYSSCIDTTKPDVSDSNKFIELTIANFGKYMQTTCMQLCYQDYLVSRFSCYDPLLPNFQNHFNVRKLLIIMN